MIPLIRAEPQTDHDRTLEKAYKGFGVLNGEHNVIFLISRDTVRYQIKIAEILFTFFQLYHYDISIWGGPNIRTSLPYKTAGSYSRQKTPVSVGIQGRNDTVGIFGPQGPVNVFSAVFGAVF